MTVSKIGLKTLSQVKEGLISGNWGSVDVDDWLIRATMTTCATPEEVRTRGLSPEDLEDMRDGKMPYETLKCFVKTWCEMGKPNQNAMAATLEEVKAASDKVIARYSDALNGLASR